MTDDVRPSGRAPGPVAAIVAIATNTFREAIRDRILYLLLAFALVMIFASRLLSLMTVGDEIKIVKDLGLSAISMFGLLTAVFVGVSLLYKEIEKRTVYTLLANPVQRWQFVAGKFFGLVVLLGILVGLMSIALFALVTVYGESPLPLVPAVVLILVELVLVTSFACLFSSFTNPILAAVGTAAVYAVGHLSWSFGLLKDRVEGRFGQVVCDVLYWVLPNLDLMNVKARAVHGLGVPAGLFGAAVLYGVGYSVVVVVVACVVFERRDFN